MYSHQTCIAIVFAVLITIITRAHVPLTGNCACHFCFERPDTVLIELAFLDENFWGLKFWRIRHFSEIREM